MEGVGGVEDERAGGKDRRFGEASVREAEGERNGGESLGSIRSA